MTEANALPLKCTVCDHAWDEPQQLPMEMSVWLKKFRKLKCPKCNAPLKKLAIPFGSATATIQEVAR